MRNPTNMIRWSRAVLAAAALAREALRSERASEQTVHDRLQLLEAPASGRARPADRGIEAVRDDPTNDARAETLRPRIQRKEHSPTLTPFYCLSRLVRLRQDDRLAGYDPPSVVLLNRPDDQ